MPRATLLLLIAVTTACASLPRESGFLNRTLSIEGRTARYVVYVPAHLPRNPPIVLFLHGAGERGDDGLRQIEVGLGRAIRWDRERFPMIAVFPQAREGRRWIGEEADLAMRALDRTIEEFDADRTRVYLTGMSLGGYGTWHLAMQHPDRFAALVPICSGVADLETTDVVGRSPITRDEADPYAATAERVKHLPAWIFHGADDRLIPPSESRRMFEELLRRGADVRYSELAGVGHNAWDPAYAQTELWSWLLRQRR